LIALSYSYDALLTVVNGKSRRKKAAERAAERVNGDRASEDGGSIVTDVRLGDVGNGDSIMLE